MTTSELDLIDRPEVRARYYERTGVLDKVKGLSMLPDDLHVTTEMVANYYEVPVSTVQELTRANRAELVVNGYHVPTGQTFTQVTGVKLRGRPPALFTRRTLLNVGMLLRDSEIAKQVRAYLLDVEETADAPQREAAIDMVALTTAVAQGVTQGLAPMVQTLAEALGRAGHNAPMIDPWTSQPSPEIVYPLKYSSGKIGGIRKPYARIPVSEYEVGGTIHVRWEDGSLGRATIIGSYQPPAWRGDLQAYLSVEIPESR